MPAGELIVPPILGLHTNFLDMVCHCKIEAILAALVALIHV